jgi:hypothetical protein
LTPSHCDGENDRRQKGAVCKIKYKLLQQSACRRIAVDRQITLTITIMALSDNKEQFKGNFDRIHSIKLPEKKGSPSA